MGEKIKTTSVKGTADILPKQMQLMQGVLDIIRQVFSQNGFNQIQTPILESLELLTKGDSGDNSKMMFKTIKRGAKLNLSKPNLTESDIVEEGLRYDLTVPLSRLYANNINELPKPFKALQIGQSFRAEKPQNGRSREFIQCDMDIFGEDTNLAEIELILSAYQAYKAMGLKNVQFKINDRRILNQLFYAIGFKNEDVSKLLITIDKCDKIGIDGVKDELLQQGFDIEIVDKLLKAIDCIKQNGVQECASYGVDKKVLDDMCEIINITNSFMEKGFSVSFDISIIRGQGYYTGTVFEAYCTDANFERAIGGGGRYDNMLKRYLNEDVCAVGYSIGLVPCLIILEYLGITLNQQKQKIVLLYKKEDSKLEVIKQKNSLMFSYCVTIMQEPKNYKSFMQKMKNLGYVAIIKLNQDKLIEL